MKPAYFPFKTGPLHFVGIGGIGMSGIAEVMLNLGYQVQGSDLRDNASIQRLRERGARVFIGHAADNLEGVGTLVVSSAIKQDNPELKEARLKGLPIVPRAEMLAELMRLKWTVAVAGSHGKTTTTSLVAAIMEAGGLDPTVINGGIINAYGANAKLGQGDWMVVEADESDGSFVKLRSSIALVTNIDPEHMDHYQSFDDLRDAYDVFVENLPFYGVAVLCADHPEVQALKGRLSDRRAVTYGFSPQADVRVEKMHFDKTCSHFDLVFRGEDKNEDIRWEGLSLPMGGRHNVQNAAAALVVARELGITQDQARMALSRFEGVKRRFTHVGMWKGIEIIDDYGHHPVEIAAVLKAARAMRKGRLLAVMQPHRYSRLSFLFDEFCTCFNDADAVFITPVYAAGEEPVEGLDHKALIEGVTARGHRYVTEITRDNLAETLGREARSGDHIIFFGAGDITGWAYDLPRALEALSVEDKT